MTRLRYPVLALLALALASCGDSSGPSGGGCDEQLLTVTITPSTSPTISWSPDCTLAEVAVVQLSEPVDTLKTKWQVQSEGNVIRSPVSYGAAPAGTSVLIPPKLLLLGTQYVVRMSSRDAVSGQLFVQAQESFTPQ